MKDPITLPALIELLEEHEPTLDDVEIDGDRKEVPFCVCGEQGENETYTEHMIGLMQTIYLEQVL